MYDTYQQRLDECDEQLQKHLATFASALPPELTKEELKRKKTKPAKNAPRFELNHELQRIIGVDLTRIDGIDVMVAQTLISEVGLDMSRWQTETHFSSWLGLCPDSAPVEIRCWPEAPDAWSIAPLQLCGWLLSPCCALAPTSERNTDSYAPSSAPRKPLRRWPTGSLDWSIEYLSTVSNTLTKAPSTTSTDIADNRSSS
jgi:hypothetical protein